MYRRSALLVALGAVLVLAAPAAGDNSGKIAQPQERIAAARQREAALNSQIAAVTSKIRALESRVGDVSQRLSILEQDLALHQRRLDKLNALYAFETQRLHFLRREYDRVVHTLNLRMIDIYESHDTTLAEVIIDSKSFQDALDHIHYLNAIAAQDKRIAADVGEAKHEMKITRAKTKRTRAQVAAATRAVAVRTAQQRAVREELLATQTRLAGARKSKRSALVSTKEQEQRWVAEANALAA